MKILKKMFQKRFTKKQNQDKEIHKNPNRAYEVGNWQVGKCKVTARILLTNGNEKKNKKRNSKKTKVTVTNASYVFYEVEVDKAGKLYQKCYLYRK